MAERGEGIANRNRNARADVAGKNAKSLSLPVDDSDRRFLSHATIVVALVAKNNVEESILYI